jgi:hypothetical protein
MGWGWKPECYQDASPSSVTVSFRGPSQSDNKIIQQAGLHSFQQKSTISSNHFFSNWIFLKLHEKFSPEPPEFQRPQPFVGLRSEQSRALLQIWSSAYRNRKSISALADGSRCIGFQLLLFVAQFLVGRLLGTKQKPAFIEACFFWERPCNHQIFEAPEIRPPFRSNDQMQVWMPRANSAPRNSMVTCEASKSTCRNGVFNRNSRDPTATSSNHLDTLSDFWRG